MTPEPEAAGEPVRPSRQERARRRAHLRRELDLYDALDRLEDIPLLQKELRGRIEKETQESEAPNPVDIAKLEALTPEFARLRARVEEIERDIQREQEAVVAAMHRPPSPRPRAPTPRRAPSEVKQFYIQYWYTVGSKGHIDQILFNAYFWYTHEPTLAEANRIITRAIAAADRGYLKLAEINTFPTPEGKDGLLFRDDRESLWDWNTGPQEPPIGDLSLISVRVERLRTNDYDTDHPEPKPPRIYEVTRSEVL